ncbi:hypothetical protein EZS27_005575 [termite gut metagenome]|uniref:LysM domain-containing protein n=1 Tax=termite gut metagenome TaxID=433724 RepID=A0A5J4SN95_9ZZZZ
MPDKLKIVTLYNNKVFEVKINPSSFSVSKNIKYTEDKTLGTSEVIQKFSQYDSEALSFEFILDATGVVYKKIESIDTTIQKFEEVVYRMDSDKHSPNIVCIAWGEYSLEGVVDSVKYDYTLFSSHGEALRVKVSVSFRGYANRIAEQKRAGKNSPDLSRIITLRAGETISALCHEIYGDSSFCVDIARYNHLSGFRDVKPGTVIMFPPLTHNG